MQYSVIVASYNSKYEDLITTIDSILIQKDIEFEIIVCDDGSEDSHFTELKKHFEDKNFTEYKLIGDGINRGTVKNVLRGLRVAEGRYAKLIGAGDALYDEDTLRRVREFMIKERTECCFGRVWGFTYRDDNIVHIPRQIPRDLRAYRKQNTKHIVRNILLCEDWVSGAAIFATTRYYVKYISMLEGTVLYCEDWSTALAILDHRVLKFFDAYVMKYEVSEGVSNNLTFRQKLLQDNVNFWKLFDELCESGGHIEFEKYIKKRKRKKKYDDVRNTLLMYLLKTFAVPEMLLYELDCRIQKLLSKK